MLLFLDKVSKNKSNKIHETFKVLKQGICLTEDNEGRVSEHITMGRIKEDRLSIWLRLAGVIPLFLFLARLQFFLKSDTPGHILWMCHVANFTLALGLFLGKRELIRVSVLWLIIGAPLWTSDMARFGLRSISTFGTHIGGLIIGVIALCNVKFGHRSWLYAFLFFIVLQQASSFFTSPELNVNAAHYVYRGWEMLFSNYLLFRIVTTALSGLVLWGIGKGLVRFFPPGK